MDAMRAVVFKEFGVLPVVRDVPAPWCPPTGVVLHADASGVCRSDWHGWQGHDDGIRLPHVPGHELAGTIVEVGPGVRDWVVGDQVTVPFVCACGQCDTCRRGEHQVCDRQFQPGFTHWGSFAELVAIDHAQVNLVRIPDNMAFETAAGLGCRFATAYRAVVHHGRVQNGDWVAVHGCGGVGLSAVMIAAARGAHIIAVDISATALELARTLGATATFNPGHVDVVNAIRDLTGCGAQVSIDALGSIKTCQNSIRSLRKRGRHVQVGLMLAADDMPPLPMTTVISAELEIVGSHGMAAHDYPAMLAEIAAGKLSPQRLVRHRIDLCETPAKLAALDHQPGNGITIISPRQQ